MPSLTTLEILARALRVELRDLLDFPAVDSCKEEALAHYVRDLRKRSESDIRFLHDLTRRLFRHFIEPLKGR